MRHDISPALECKQNQERTKAKKSLKKATKPLAPEASAKQSDRAYPAEPHELNGQRQRLKQAAAVGAEALRSSAPAPTPDLYPALAAVSPPPRTPLASLWRIPAASQGASKSAQAPARQARTQPVRAAAAQASPAPASPAVKLPVEWEPTTSPGKAAALAEAPKPTAPQSVKVSFVFLDLGAKQVSLSGDFNGWSPSATPMRRDSSGHWETTADLAPGRYQYKFVVDGEWVPDPHAHENVWNQHGTLNSVIEVRA
ncbi:MAG: hypothetical protein ACLQU3_03910 [Limisphaerales bacterium]